MVSRRRVESVALSASDGFLAELLALTPAAVLNHPDAADAPPPSSPQPSPPPLPLRYDSVAEHCALLRRYLLAEAVASVASELRTLRSQPRASALRGRVVAIERVSADVQLGVPPGEKRPVGDAKGALARGGAVSSAWLYDVCVSLADVPEAVEWPRAEELVLVGGVGGG